MREVCEIRNRLLVFSEKIGPAIPTVIARCWNGLVQARALGWRCWFIMTMRNGNLLMAPAGGLPDTVAWAPEPHCLRLHPLGEYHS